MKRAHDPCVMVQHGTCQPHEKNPREKRRPRPPGTTCSGSYRFNIRINRIPCTLFKQGLGCEGKSRTSLPTFTPKKIRPLFDANQRGAGFRWFLDGQKNSRKQWRGWLALPQVGLVFLDLIPIFASAIPGAEVSQSEHTL